MSYLVLYDYSRAIPVETPCLRRVPLIGGLGGKLEDRQWNRYFLCAPRRIDDSARVKRTTFSPLTVMMSWV
ncbi:MAG: hypothetical protein ACLQNE_36325 [Thermoguttaceae bacterium]